MTDSIIELSEEAFAAIYPLRTNHFNPAAAWDNGEGAGCLFETYSDELAFVRQQNPLTVWTLIDGDDGDQYVLTGFHLVNRIGYLLSTVPVPEGTTIQVHIPMQSEGSAETTAHTPEPWTYNHTAIVHDSQDTILADCEIIPPAGGTISPPAQEVANARRICAAVNACKGIGTEALERGIITDLRHVLAELLTAAADLDAAIDGVTDQFDEERMALDAAYRAAGAALTKATGRTA